MKYVLEVLFPYIFLLYVFDCITYVKARHVLLTSLFGKKFALKRSGVHPAGLLPISRAIISPDLPIYYSRDGIYAVFDTSCSSNRIDRAEDFSFIKFEELEFIKVEGKNIKFDHTHTLKTHSSASARFHAEFINNLKMSEPAVRKEKIKAHLSDGYDLAAIKKIETSISKSLTMIKIVSCALFVLVFFALPVILFSDLSGYIRLNAWVACIILNYALLLLVSLPATQKLYKSEKELRSCIFLSIIFSPINAVHILSYLTKDLYFRFNYLAAAACFMDRDSFVASARKEIFLIDYFENEIDRPDWLEFWRLKKDRLQGLLGECGITLQEILTPPEKQDQTAVSYCPICMTEYREKRRNCIDCEVVLEEFGRGSTGLSMNPALDAKS